MSIYDLILMDVQMPDMDGYEATQKIRSIEKNFNADSENQRKRIPIIALTANAFKEDIEKCISAGMDDHLGKPIDESELFEKLEKYL